MSQRNYKLREVIVNLIADDKLSEITVSKICGCIALADELLLADLELLDRAWCEGYGAEPVEIDDLTISRPTKRLFGEG